MKLPRISIVIPSYNKVDYIDETLRSIVSQRYPNLEVIIQDGGSTDGTLDIIKKYAKRYPKTITWESKKDKGQADAINKGFKKATGEVLAFLNADDIYEKGALMSVGKFFTHYPRTFWLAGRGKVIDENGKEIALWVTWIKNIFLNLNNYTLLLIVNYIMQPSVFVNKSFFKDLGKLSGIKHYVIEYETWLNAGKYFMPKVVNKDLSRFRLVSNGASLTSYKSILEADYKAAEKYSRSFIILGLHKLFNLCRILLIK